VDNSSRGPDPEPVQNRLRIPGRRNSGYVA
jgi:hypothetical protein